MPFFIAPDSTARHLDWDRDADAVEARIAAGETFFATLGGAVLHGGVVATAFDTAIALEAVYDAGHALAHPGMRLPPPAGHRAKYRIAVVEGRLHHPPLHPNAVRETPLPIRPAHGAAPDD